MLLSEVHSSKYVWYAYMLVVAVHLTEYEWRDDEYDYTASITKDWYALWSDLI